MKILNITEEGRFGGPHKRIIDVAVELRRLAVETEILFPHKDSDNFECELKKHKLRYSKIKITRPTFEFKYFVRYVLFFIPELVRLIRIIKQGEYDIVHVNGAHQFKSAVASALARKRFIWHINDAQFGNSIRYLFRAFGKFSSGFIFSSEQSKMYYKDGLKYLKAKPLVVSRPPINSSFFQRTSPNDLGRDSINIICVANINPIKGIATIVEAVNKLLIRNGNLKAVTRVSIIGGIHSSQKRYYAQIVEQINTFGLSEVISLSGYQEDIKSCLQRSDIFICGSTSETGPIALFEAISMQIPFVCTDVGDVKLINFETPAGIIVPINDSSVMSLALEEIIMNKSTYLKFQKNCLEITKQYLDVSIASKKHTEIYSLATME